MRLTDNKVVLITQKTRLENLIYRYNTESQACFYVEHHGGNFDDYRNEHNTYFKAKKTAVEFLESYGRLQIVDREFLPNFLFGEKDVVVVLGRDGLVANVMKYLTTQKLIGVNPDPRRWDGVLLPFGARDLKTIVPEVFGGGRKAKKISFAEAQLEDGRMLFGVNDLFIGRKTHASARYSLSFNDAKEAQSSSGIIVSTGLGATGWLKSIIAGAAGIDRFFGIEESPRVPRDFTWDTRALYFTVREPYPSTSTGAELVFGKIEDGKALTIESFMAENGVIFSDGVEEDFLEFNAGSVAKIRVADKQGRLVV